MVKQALRLRPRPVIVSTYMGYGPVPHLGKGFSVDSFLGKVASPADRGPGRLLGFRYSPAHDMPPFHTDSTPVTRTQSVPVS